MIDNLRLDQWKIIKEDINRYFTIENESVYFSILPTATQYARNSFFAGLTPLEINKQFPNWWKFDHEEGGKNIYEKELLKEQCKRLRISR